MASSSPKGTRSSISGTQKSSAHHVASIDTVSTRGVSLSLPLLEGLCLRPQVGKTIVDSALAKYQASRKIAEWVAAKWRKKPRNFSSQIPHLQQMPSHQHWLWDAMQSTSRSERHVAARLLLQGGCPCSTCRTAVAALSSSSSSTVMKSDKASTAADDYAQFTLQQILLALWNRYVQPTIHPTASVPAVAVQPYIPMEWMALMKHVILGKAASEDRISAFCLGGIPWLCQSIWELVLSLSTSKTGDASAPMQLQALIGMVELCYSLLLVVFVDAETKPENHASSTGATTAATPTAAASASAPSSSAAASSAASPSSSQARRRRLVPGLSAEAVLGLSPSSGNRRSTASARGAAAASLSASLSELQSNREKAASNFLTSPAVNKRIESRRKLMKKLFWKTMIGMDPAATDPATKHSHPHMHPVSSPLSPLACLIGAFHLWKTSTNWPYPGPTADACLTMLRQLVDPTSAPKPISLAGLTTSPPATAATATPKTREPPNSASSNNRIKRRRRTRSSSGSSQQQLPQAHQQSSSASSTTFLFRPNVAPSSGVAAASANATSSTERRRARAAELRAAEHGIPRLLSSVLGTSRRSARNVSAGHHDEIVEAEDVIMADVDGVDDDDSDVEVDVAELHNIDNGAANEEDEEIDSDEGEGNNEDEHQEEENEHDEAHDNDEEDDEDEDEDEEEEDGEIDDEDDEELEEHEIVLHDEDVARLEEGLLELNDATGSMEIDLEDIVAEEGTGSVGSMIPSRNRLRASTSGEGTAGEGTAGAITRRGNAAASEASKADVDEKELAMRQRLYLHACMHILTVQHPPLLSSVASISLLKIRSPSSQNISGGWTGSPAGQAPPTLASKCFSLVAEQSLLEAIMGIVRPPKKPVNTKMIMRRAPTQEEFFRGSLSRNPISLSMLKPSGGNNSGSASSGDAYEPTVRDLRQHIADDLQMSDSAELLELLVGNKILDVNLKLRVVHQVLYKNHLIEQNQNPAARESSSGSALASLLASSGAGGAPAFFSTGSGLSMMFSSSSLAGINLGTTRGGAGAVLSRVAGGNAVTADTPLDQLPPMLVTYRLAGVDGEATEDTVSNLVDPEAPSDAMSSEELEQLMEKEYGITRIVTEGRGVYVMLRSIEHYIQEILRGIRRDDLSVLMEYGEDKFRGTGKNVSRKKFKTQEAYPGLTLLMCCAKLPSNRKKLLQARAPTILLRLLLDVLNALEDPMSKARKLVKDSSETSDSGSNKTAKILQELIEVLASDISTTAVSASTKKTDQDAMDDCQTDETGSTTDSVVAAAEGQDQDATTLSLVLSSLETISLSPPLRNIIAKLLPFLTYGQVDLSRELALNFLRNVDIDSLLDDDDKKDDPDGEAAVDLTEERGQEKENQDILNTPMRGEGKNSVLMDAFVQASITLPPNEVCNSLRTELINCGFIHRLASFILTGVPSFPPPWSAALLPRDEFAKLQQSIIKQTVVSSWREFFVRRGVRKAFKMLIGLCKHHPQTQSFIAQIGEESDKASNGNLSFLQACHWMEATSDSASNRVYVRDVGLLAETLLDELMDENDVVTRKVNALRQATKQRKKQIAEERRNKALRNMSSFGSLAGQAAATTTKSESTVSDSTQQNQSSTGVRGTAASLLAPVLGFFGGSAGDGTRSSSEAAAAAAVAGSSGSSRSRQGGSANNSQSKQCPQKKPAWMAEMENLEEEEGLVCSVCQEGRTLQPSELLGLYAYVKKVSIGVDQCGSRDNIDGTTLLKVLPPALPKSLAGTHAAEHWYPAGNASGDGLRDTQRSALSLTSSVSGRRNTYYTTTVSAGNPIHFSCHQKARQADRNHPKAPKSEWEGAILRNSRVNCNVILPLVSSKSSDVPLVAVDSALTEYQTAVNNLTGSAPKSMLWTVLHDVRFLLLRMAHGELLSADCGGGSLASNAQLLIHQLMMADMFEKDAQVDSPETARHVRNLSAGFLTACSIVHAEDYDKKGGSNSILLRSIADAAPMAALTCILSHNNRDDFGAGDSSDSKPHPKRRWITGRELFLRGLIICAGRRHALGIDNSGCISGRAGSATTSSRSMADWTVTQSSEESSASRPSASGSANSGRRGKKRALKPDISDFGPSLRPMVTLFAIMDHLSTEFQLNLDDAGIENVGNRLVKIIEQCHRAKDIRQLLEEANSSLDFDSIIEDFQRGLMAA